MAKGIPRNTATSIATYSRLQGYSYSNYYRQINPYITLSCCCKKLKTALTEVSKSAVLLANKFKQLITCCEVQNNDL